MIDGSERVGAEGRWSRGLPRIPRTLAEAFWLKLWFNLKAEARNTYLSYFWWVLEPLLLALIFYLVFEFMLERGGPNFLLFLLLGKIPFVWFSKSINNAANSIIAGRGLINQVAIPKAFFPLLVCAQDAVKQLVVILALSVAVSIMGFPPGLGWFYIPVVYLAQLALIVPLAMVVSAIVPYLPDFKYIVHTGMIMVLLGSGIFYDYREALDPHLQAYFVLNPMVQVIEAYRDIFLRNEVPNMTGLFLTIALSMVLLGLMLRYFRSFGTSYARLLAQ